MKYSWPVLFAAAILVGCASSPFSGDRRELPPGKYRFAAINSDGKQVGQANVYPGSDQVFARGVLCLRDDVTRIVVYDESGSPVAGYICIRK